MKRLLATMCEPEVATNEILYPEAEHTPDQGTAASHLGKRKSQIDRDRDRPIA